MSIHIVIRTALLFFMTAATSPLVHAEMLKPFILGNTPAGNLEQAAEATKAAVKAKGFEIVGSYSPYAGAIVICATNNELKTTAAKIKNGGFGVAQRIGVTEVKSKIQVSYVNPTYMGIAYGMGRLENVAASLKDALGAVQTFGSEKGISAEELPKYHYAMFMPYFDDVDFVHELKDHKTAIETVEKNLAAGVAGAKKVYRVDLPGKDISVFGVAIVTGDGIAAGNKDTDKEIMDIIDYQDLRHTAYLPYEMIVDGTRIYALPGRYRIALYFPDTAMTGAHGFTQIMSAPPGILLVIEQLTGLKRF